MLGGGDGIGGGSIHDETSELGGGLQIDIINSDAGPSNDLQAAFSRLKELASDLSPAPHDQGVANRDLGAEVLRGEIVGAIDVGEGTQQLETSFSQLLGDENSGFRSGDNGFRISAFGYYGGGGGGNNICNWNRS